MKLSCARLWLVPSLLLSLAGCGDIGTVRIDVAFPTEGDIQSRTKALLLVVRDVKDGKNGCDLLWSTQPAGVAESRSVIEYPNTNDVLAAPVKLSMYPSLTLLVFAHPSKDVTTTRPLAGGCIQSPIAGEESQTLKVDLKKAP